MSRRSLRRCALQSPFVEADRGRLVAAPRTSGQSAAARARAQRPAEVRPCAQKRAEVRCERARALSRVAAPHQLAQKKRLRTQARTRSATRARTWTPVKTHGAGGRTRPSLEPGRNESTAAATKASSVPTTWAWRCMALTVACTRRRTRQTGRWGALLRGVPAACVVVCSCNIVYSMTVVYRSRHGHSHSVRHSRCTHRSAERVSIGAPRACSPPHRTHQLVRRRGWGGATAELEREPRLAGD